ncbi:hypothetical protein AB0I28_12345 [Phytomonospora sp. NPDC050363]|uniref:hypothetical protein n=1 Tax=Phytomonospora sp. NPDC050363 TaxID=3155642 RepID=UPI0033EF17AA
MTTLDVDQWNRPTTPEQFQQFLSDLLTAFAGSGYDLGTWGPIECLKAVLASRELLAEIVEEGAEELVIRARAAQVRAETDLEQMRRECVALRVQVEANRIAASPWEAEDM